MRLSLPPEVLPEVMRPLAKAIEGRADYARRLADILKSLAPSISRQEAVRLAVALRELSNDDSYVWALTDQFVRAVVPEWHFVIVKDEKRNSVYDNALRALVTPETYVLEIGTGSGILAMMAARAGARHVYTIEVEPVLAEAARSNISKNGFSDQITVINKDVLKVRVGEDLPQRCGLLVHEIVSNDLLGQRVLSLVGYARRELLLANALMLPQFIEARGMLVGDKAAWKVDDEDACAGFDVRAINILASRTPGRNAKKLPNLPLSDPVTVLSIDLARDQLTKEDDTVGYEKTRFVLEAFRDGEARSVLQWIRFVFPGGAAYENVPGQASCWGTRMHPFDISRHVIPGEQIECELETGDKHLLISLPTKVDT